MDVFFPCLILAILTTIIIGLQILSRRETRRRALLTPEERKQLEEEDAIFAQQYSF